jgi:hypothetical protein
VVAKVQWHPGEHYPRVGFIVRCVVFQMAEVVVSRHLFVDILRLIAELRPPPVTSTAH